MSWNLVGNIRGPAGSQGPSGSSGTSAFTLTTASFVQPSVNSSVTVNVANNSWVALGQYLFIASAGTYQVSAIGTGTLLLINTGATGNVNAGSTVANAQAVSPAGPPGPAGASGTSAAPTISGSYGSPNLITSAGITAPNNRKTVMYIKGSGGPIDLTSNYPQISAGNQDGDEIVLVCVDSTNTITLANGNGLKQNGSRTMADGTRIQYIWNAGATRWEMGWDNNVY